MTDETRVGSPEPETTGTDTDDSTVDGTLDGPTPTADDDTGTGSDTTTENPEPTESTKSTESTEVTEATEAGTSSKATKARGSDGGDDGGDDTPARSGRASLPLVPVLAVLLVLLLGGAGYLFLTRPGTSAVATGDYVDALQAARSGIVDVASFDYLTLDDDITQIEAVTTGDLRTESVDQLNSRRQDITTAQAVVNTEVVGAAVGAADDSTATVYMVIQSTQTSSASQQAQVQRYRIEVDLTKDGDRWLLSGIQGR